MAIDRTNIIEDRVSPKELKVGRREYRRFFQFVFSRVYVASSFLLCLGIGGELLLPLAAVLWKTFVDRVSAMSVGVGIGSGVVLSLAGYMLLSCVREAAGQMTQRVGEQAFVLDEVQKNRFAEHVLAKMHAKISRLPADYFESAAFYDRVERAFAFAGDRMRREVIGGFYAVASGAIGAVVCLAALAAYHPVLCAAAALAPLPTLYSRIVESRISLRLRRDTSEDRRRLEYYEELVRRSAAKELKVMDAGEFIMGKWEALAARYARAEIDTRLKSGCVRLIGVLVNALAASGSAALAVWLLTRGDLSLGAVAAVLPLTQALVKNVGAAMAGLGDVVANRREIAQLLEFLDLPEDPDETDADCPEFQSVEVKGLRFRYPFSDRFVLKGMDFSIRRGDIVALVGPNGSGKSTFVKILLGILTPTEGDLLVNGADATGSRDWNRSLSGVFQDFGQYRGLTVQDNVRLADIASSDPVPSALHRAGFSQYPPEAMLGRDVDGVEPSVGGWQALAIARGFYRDRGLLVLDEPTASLDPLAEEAVFQKFLMLSRDKTAIIVTHRTGTAALANRIVVFEDGRIVEQGTGAELLARGGVFSAMYRAQAEWYRRPGDASRQPPEASAGATT